MKSLRLVLPVFIVMLPILVWSAPPRPGAFELGSSHSTIDPHQSSTDDSTRPDVERKAPSGDKSQTRQSSDKRKGIRRQKNSAQSHFGTTYLRMQKSRPAPETKRSFPSLQSEGGPLVKAPTGNSFRDKSPYSPSQHGVFDAHAAVRGRPTVSTIAIDGKQFQSSHHPRSPLGGTGAVRPRGTSVVDRGASALSGNNFKPRP